MAGVIYGVLLNDQDVVLETRAVEATHYDPQLPEGFTAIADAATWLALMPGSTRNPNGTFTPPASAPVLASKDRFRRVLLTRAERVFMELLAITVDTPEQRQAAAVARSWQQDFDYAPDPINLRSPDVTTGLTALAPAFLAGGVWADQAVASARIARILANLPPE